MVQTSLNERISFQNPNTYQPINSGKKQTLRENYLYLDANLNNLLNSITFQEIIENLVKKNLPLQMRYSNFAQYFEIAGLEFTSNQVFDRDVHK